MARVQNINTPRGTIFKTPNGMAELKWNPNFKNEWEGKYTEAQKYVDSNVLRLSEPFTPLRSSMLVKSGTLGTFVGSGEVAWIAPYARRQYYSKRIPGSATGPLRGPRWFDRMMAIKGKEIIKNAKRKFGG